MNNSYPLKTFAAACSLAFAGAALAQTTVSGSTSSGITTAAGGSGTSAVYLKRTDTRFGAFTGSTENTDSLASGLRTGSEVTLTGSGETVTFTPPTKPMGYGNVTRAMDLAQRDLAAAGITDPTPTEIRIAMMGGTITRTEGTTSTTTTFDGVLTLRSQGMGWGKIAHTIGVHPGMGKAAAPVPATTSTSTSTTTSSAAPASGSASTGITTAGSRSGIVTAAGGSGNVHGHGRALGLSAGSNSGATTTAAGASAAGGGAASSGKGHGNAFGRGGK
jgi:hypothetical protein